MKEIFERVSIRKYTDQPVEEEKILAILRAAMAAPSAGNQQPWEFYIVRDRSKLEELSRVSPYAGCTKTAPRSAHHAGGTNGNIQQKTRTGRILQYP